MEQTVKSRDAIYTELLYNRTQLYEIMGFYCIIDVHARSISQYTYTIHYLIIIYSETSQITASLLVRNVHVLKLDCCYYKENVSECEVLTIYSKTRNMLSMFVHVNTQHFDFFFFSSLLPFALYLIYMFIKKF